MTWVHSSSVCSCCGCLAASHIRPVTLVMTLHGNRHVDVTWLCRVTDCCLRHSVRCLTTSTGCCGWIPTYVIYRAISFDFCCQPTSPSSCPTVFGDKLTGRFVRRSQGCSSYRLGLPRPKLRGLKTKTRCIRG